MPNVDIIVGAKQNTDAAFKALISNLDQTGKASIKAQKDVESLTVRAGKLSDAIGKTSTTLARSADAFGLSAGAMRQIGDVADVAQLGFENLTTSAVGFNASSLAVVGAGFAIGTALGNLAMQFDVVRENAFAAGEAIHNAFSSQQTQGVQEMAAATANWAIEQKKVAAAREELLRKVTGGMSAEQIQKMFFPEPPKDIRQQILDEAKAYEDGQKKKAAAAKQAAEAAKAAAKVAAAEQRRSDEEINRLREHTATEWEKFYATLNKEESDLTKWVQEQAQARTDFRVKGILEEHEARQRAEEDRKAAEEKAAEDAIKAWKDQQDAIQNVSQATLDLGDILGGALGTAFNIAGNLVGAFGNVRASIDQISNAGSGLTGLLGKIGGGLGIAGTVLSVGKGIFDSLFGGAKKAREEMDKLRGEFIKSSGGMQKLSAEAKAAGVSLDGLFKQKNAEALSKQIDTIKAKLADWNDAQDLLREGMEKYGITAAEMGAQFAGMELDKQAKEIALFFAAAMQIGADSGAVTEKMKGDVLALVAQYQAAGLAIPEAMRPVLEAMLKNGDLVDENGEAYSSLEAAGITFAQTMEGALSDIADEINKLMRVLAQGFHIPISYEVNGDPGGGSAGGAGGGGGHNAPREEEVPEFANEGTAYFPIAGGLARLHGTEHILKTSTLKDFIQEATRAGMAAGISGGSNGGTIVVPVNIGNQQLGKITADLSRRRQSRTNPSGIRRF